MTNNGTLDTRASQYLVREEVISAKQEYGRFNPKKISGGNAIWITNIPPNVKVWYSTDNNFEHKQRLDYMNRGTRYSTIGQQGQNQLFDNFYIFTEGTADEDILINVASSGDSITPILSSNTNQIDQVDAVGKIGSLDLIQSLSPQVIAQIAKAVQGVYYKPPIHTIRIQGECSRMGTNDSLYRCAVLPLGLENGILSLKLKDDKFYKIEFVGHFDIGGTDEGYSETGSVTANNANAHFCLFNNTNGATATPITDREFDNFYAFDKRVWADEKNDVFDIIGLKYINLRNAGTYSYLLETTGFNSNNDSFFLKGEFINKYENFGYFMNFSLYTNDLKGKLESHCSILVNIYEIETCDSIIESKK